MYNTNLWWEPVRFFSSKLGVFFLMHIWVKTPRFCLLESYLLSDARTGRVCSTTSSEHPIVTLQKQPAHFSSLVHEEC